MPDFTKMILMIFGVIIALYIIIAIFKSSEKKQQKNNVESIELGMSEEEMLSIMGTNYNKSLLKNNRVKYEYRFSNGTSTGYSYRGVSSRTYHGVRKVAIYCKDGVVEEVRPYNL